MTDRPAPPLRPLRTIRLQLWLPLLLLVVSLGSMAVLAVLQQREHQLAGDEHGVHTLMRHGGVAAFSLDGDGKFIR